MNKLFQKIKLFFLDKPLPPITEREQDLIENLKAEFKEGFNSSEITAEEWKAFKESLKHHINNAEIRSFLRWEPVKGTMFVGNASYIKSELDYLKKSNLWEKRWSKAIIESKVGNPLPSVLHPNSSGNIIHHAYHLAQFEEKTKVAINELELVFEFGGGYGSMCRLFHNLGFSGKYVIFDLPTFSSLQKFYLKSLSLPVQQFDTLNEKNKGIFCVSDIDALKKLLALNKADSCCSSLFLATWSLSEVPLELRDVITPLISKFDNFLVAYQNKAFKIDNVQYFKQFKEQFTSVTWQNWDIEHLAGNKYLMGNS